MLTGHSPAKNGHSTIEVCCADHKSIRKLGALSRVGWSELLAYKIFCVRLKLTVIMKHRMYTD